MTDPDPSPDDGDDASHNLRTAYGDESDGDPAGAEQDGPIASPDHNHGSYAIP